MHIYICIYIVTVANHRELIRCHEPTWTLNCMGVVDFQVARARSYVIYSFYKE